VSARLTGRSVSSLNLSSRPASKAPPPVRTIPLSLISADNSGGVFSRAFLTAWIIVFITGSRLKIVMTLKGKIYICVKN